MAFRLILILTVIALVAGCATDTIDLNRFTLSLSPEPDEQEYPGSEQMLSGFELRDEGEAVASGDSVLFGFTVQRRGAEEIFFLRLTKLATLDSVWSQTFTRERDGREEDFTLRSPLSMVMLSVHDATGEEIETGISQLPLLFLNDGAIGLACDSGVGPPHDTSIDGWSESDKSKARGWMALSALVNVAMDISVIQDQVRDCFASPSLLSIIFGGGIHVQLDSISPSPPRLFMLGDQAIESCSTIIPASANGQLALVAHLRLAEVRAPLGLAGGIVELEIRHPRDEHSTIRGRLLAARRYQVH